MALSVHHFGPDILITIGWIAIKVATDLHGTQRRNPSDFPLTFHLVQPTGQHLHCSNTTVHDKIALKLMTKHRKLTTFHIIVTQLIKG